MPNLHSPLALFQRAARTKVLVTRSVGRDKKRTGSPRLKTKTRRPTTKAKGKVIQPKRAGPILRAGRPVTRGG